MVHGLLLTFINCVGFQKNEECFLIFLLHFVNNNVTIACLTFNDILHTMNYCNTLLAVFVLWLKSGDGDSYIQNGRRCSLYPLGVKNVVLVPDRCSASKGPQWELLRYF